MESRIISNRQAEYGNLTKEKLSLIFARMLHQIEDVSTGVIDWGSFKFDMERESIEEVPLTSTESLQTDWFSLKATVLELVEGGEDESN